MSIDWQTVSIPFGQGVGTKTDPKMLQSGKLTTLTNGIFQKSGRLSKRNGYTNFGLSIIGGGTIGTQQMLGTMGQRLLCASSGVLYDYSETANAWKNAGKWDSIKADDIFVSGAFPLERNASSVISGNYSIVAYDSWSITTGIEAGSGTSVYLSVIDLQTNTTVKSDLIVSVDGRYSRLFLFGDGNVGIFYFTPTGTKLAFKTVSISNGAVTLGSEVSLATDIQPYNDSFDGYSQYDWFSFDLAKNGNNCTLVYSSPIGGNPIILNTLNSSGASQATTSLSSAGRAFPISTQVGSDGNIWIYWAFPNRTTGSPGVITPIRYAIFSSSLSLVLGKTTLAGTYAYVRQLAAVEVNVTTQNLYFSVVPFITGEASVDLVTPTIYFCTNTTTGTFADPFAWLFNLDIFGKTFIQNGNTYLPCVYPSIDQNTGFLIDLSDKHAAAKFLFNTCECAYSVEVNSGNTGPAIGGYWWRYPGFLTIASTYNSNRVIFSSGKIIQAIIGTTSELHFVMGSCLVDLTWNDQDSFQSLESNGIVVLNGSIPSIYDGSGVSELGFNTFPELQGVLSSTGGSLAAGNYEFQAVYQWSDGQGNLYQSEDSDPLSVTTSGTTSKITLTAKLPALTQRTLAVNPIQLLWYVTTVNGVIPYQLAQTSLSAIGGTASITDSAEIPVADQTQPIYTQGGAIVSNSPPPPSMLMWLNNNRLWMVNSEDQSIWYSKTFASLTGIEMSALLTVAPDLRFGNIVAGHAMDEKTVLIKEKGLTYFIGDGADDSGSGSSISLPQIIPTSIGGSNSRGVYLFPSGLLFRGANNRGIYLLDRGVNIQYIGADVEDFNSQNIVSIKSVPNSTQLRFLTSSGSTIMYDYFFNQWGTFTNHTGYDSTVWNGTYLYSRTDGSLYQENTTTFLDNATSYALSLTTAWIKAGTIQGFQRVRRCAMLGDFLSGNTGYAMQIAQAVDFSTTFQTPISFTLGAAGNPASFRYRERFPIQKCDTIQLQITELPTGASGQYLDFSDLGLEIGIKRGLNRLPPSQSVG